jgi:hypothetical protein
MEFWIDFWTVVLVGAIGLFALLAVVVTIGGFFDLRRMFRTMAESRDGDAEIPAEDRTGVG